MPNVGIPELILFLAIILVIFGPKRVPELARSLGRGIREFRSSVSKDDHDDADDEDDEHRPPQIENGVEEPAGESQTVGSKQA